MLTNITLATLNIFLSLVFGAIALVIVSISFPDTFAAILNGAEWVEQALGNTGLENRYNNWVRFLIGEEQLTFMLFTIIMRVIFAVVVTFGRRMFGAA
ncbi:MAG: hypothetical protein AAGF19_02920 [Pseudomonadota bacterium]